MLIGLPQRHDFFQCIFQIIEKSHLYISYFDYFTSLTCYVQTVLVSCFRPIVILYVRSTFHYRTVLQAPKPATLRLFVVHSALLLSSVYSARIWRIQLLHTMLLSPTLHSLYTSRDRGQQFLHTVIPLRLISL